MSLDLKLFLAFRLYLHFIKGRGGAGSNQIATESPSSLNECTPVFSEVFLRLLWPWEQQFLAFWELRRAVESRQLKENLTWSRCSAILLNNTVWSTEALELDKHRLMLGFWCVRRFYHSSLFPHLGNGEESVVCILESRCKSVWHYTCAVC